MGVILRGSLYSSGYGSGDGYGSGYGSGYGDGSGDGYGDLVASSPSPELITAECISAAGACTSEIRKFSRLFPSGGKWPDDCAKAEAGGLDISWVTKNLGLLPKIGGDK